MHQQNHKTALILGATGLVGNELLKLLLQDERYSQVTCLVRKSLPASLTSGFEHKLQPVVIDFEFLQDYAGYFNVDHVYVCLGTTIKKAGSKAAFKKIDFEFVYAAAQISASQFATRKNTGSFVWISSVGASDKSSNFYLRVKGELENAIFNLSALEKAATVRPSLLLGLRQESRPAEKLGTMLAPFYSPLLCGPLKKYRPVEALTVAKQMINLQAW